MRKIKLSRKKWLGLFLILIGIISNLLILNRETAYEAEKYTVYYTVNGDRAGIYQLYYSVDTNFTEEQSDSVTYEKSNSTQVVEQEIPYHTNYLRFDINQCVTEVQISDLYIEYRKNKVEIPVDLLVNSISANMIESVTTDGKTVQIKTSGDDAFICVDIQTLGLKELVNEYAKNQDLAKNVILCLIFDFILFYLYSHASQLKRLLKETYQNREMILRLAKNDFMVKYAGSYFGMIWAFVQPMVTILLYWFVFQMGLRSGSVGDTPFVLWLIAGLIPWFYFSEAVSSGTNSLVEYSYLVKKVVFNVSILPVVKVISALFVHAFFLVVMVVIFAAYGRYPDWYTIQLLYYFGCMFVLSLGLAYIASALMVFFRDLGQLINIFLQIGMWMTPIMWQYTMLPQNLQTIMKLNPMYYIITGYRDCLIDKVAFWQHSTWTLYFWFFAFAVLMVGMKLFNRLKVHFADVL